MSSTKLTLEQFVLAAEPFGLIRMIWQLTNDDWKLVKKKYADSDRFVSDMSNEEQFMFALFILEAEGR